MTMAMDKMCLKRDPTNRNYSIYDDDGSNVFNRELMDIKYSLYDDDGEGSNVLKRDPINRIIPSTRTMMIDQMR